MVDTVEQVRMTTATTTSGLRLDASGLSVAVASAEATAIDLCLNTSGSGERRYPLERVGDVWLGHFAGVREGDRYGLRAHGPALDPSVLLLDPLARAIDGRWSVAVADVPSTSAPLRRPWAETVIYEAHVRGFTRLHPGVPLALRGTYAGLAHPAAIAELQKLGITAIELLPVFEFRDEEHLRTQGQHNYWGYSPVGFCAPHAAYAASGSRGGQVAEFRALVAALHDAGIEVILDVVYNHTAEGGPGETAWSLRGLGLGTYFRDDDVTGTGNSLNASSPHVQQLVLDSLRYWVTAFGVDGFRFDLAVTLGRDDEGFDPAHPLLTAMAEDPVLAGTKLIAEPWDIGPGGYHVGGFPAPFAEWNGGYRDAVRDLWRGQGTTADLARCLAGSSDTFANARGPLAGVDFITCHDGFTLRDLVSYDEKHNQANGEQNRDGDSHNRSWNSGVEGPTDDAAICETRRRRAAAMLATVLVSQGVPMILAGDERGRTQGGNNNAYCHDTPRTWLHWDTDWLSDAVTRLIALRASQPVLRRSRFLVGDLGDGKPVDVRWLGHDGGQMDDAWQADGVRTLGMHLDGRCADEPGDTLLLVFHADDEPTQFTLPGGPFTVLFDTGDEGRAGQDARGSLDVGPWSVVVLRDESERARVLEVGVPR
jgi:isoamylase